MKTFIQNSCFYLSITLPQFALAEGGAQHGGFSELIIPWLTFLIYITALFLILRKSVAAGWDKRRTKIESAVVGGKAELKAAEELISTVRGKISNLDQELRDLKASVESDTRREGEELISTARQRAAKIIERAKEGTRAESRGAEQLIRREMAERALKIAEERLASSLSAEKDKALRERTLRNVGQLVH